MCERLSAEQARKLLKESRENIKPNDNYKKCIKCIKNAAKRGDNYCFIDTLYLDKATMTQLREDGYEIGDVVEDKLPFGNLSQRKVSF